MLLSETQALTQPSLSLETFDKVKKKNDGGSSDASVAVAAAADGYHLYSSNGRGGFEPALSAALSVNLVADLIHMMNWQLLTAEETTSLRNKIQKGLPREENGDNNKFYNIIFIRKSCLLKLDVIDY